MASDWEQLLTIRRRRSACGIWHDCDRRCGWQSKYVENL